MIGVDFIIASETHGLSKQRILFFHILYLHLTGPIALYLSQVLAMTILIETSLSYLGGGFGVEEPAPSWGNMLGMAKDYLLTESAWYPLIIAAVIALALSLIYRFSEERV